MRSAAAVHRTASNLLCMITSTIIIILLLACLIPSTNARTHYHRHRRSHRYHANHISQPPAFSPHVDSPAEPPSLSPAEPPSPSPAKAPYFSPAKPPSLLARPRAPSLSPAKTPSLSPAKAPSLSLVKPPLISLAKPPSFSSAKPPSVAPAKTPSLSPIKPPSLSRTKTPSLSPAKPPSLSPAKSPSLSPAKPPSHFPVKTPPLSPAMAKPPSLSPSKPPSLSPAKPPSHFQAKTPSLSPAMAKPPSLYPAKPPSRSPAMAKPPSLSPAKTPSRSPAKPPSLSPAVSPVEPIKNSSCGCNSTTTPSSSCVFDVRAFGAVGNGSSDDTRTFRAAWKAACSVESAVLLVPSDGVFMVTSTIFSGPCQPGLVFQIDGVLMPPDGPDCWPATDSRRQWLVFYKTDGMTLRGKGTIEGNGEKWWNLPCKPHRGRNGSTLPGPCDSPALIRFFLSNNVAVRGLRIENSPQFHIKFDGCEQVRVDGLFVSSPAFSPNTDGIHIENTRSVEIYNSRISNGDDCISIGTGCSHVHIENVTCGPSHGISIGSLGVHNTRACVSNITVRNSRIRDSDNGVRIKTWQGGTGSVSGIGFDGILMENVKNCIIIDQYYCLGKGCANQTSAVYVTDVAYSNIRGTYNAQASTPIHFACSDSVACTGITMTEVELRPYGAAALLADPYCWNAYGVMQTLTLPPVYCLQEGRPQSLQDQLTNSC